MNVTCVVLVAFPVTRNVPVINVNALMMASCISMSVNTIFLEQGNTTEACIAM